MLQSRRLLSLAATLALSLTLPYANAQSTQNINSGGVTRMIASTPGADSVRGQELSPLTTQLGDVDSALGATDPSLRSAATRIVNRSIAKHRSFGDWHQGRDWERRNPRLVTSFNGLNHRDQRLANGGNQFSIEPPDQGLCVGNGYVLETVNTVLNVYDYKGHSVLGVVDLNTFYGYPAEFNRTTGVVGPEITDPSCLYDKQTQRWFHVVLTLDVDPSTGNFTGSNHLDLAVSQTPNPLGSWTIYRIPVQDDGSQGTPNHNCPGGPCLGDYPHIGADRNGIYLTTNEFAFFAPGYHGSQVYAISKRALARSAKVVNVYQFDTADQKYLFEGNPGFTVWPAQSPTVQFDYGDTEFFVSSLAVFTDSGTDNRLRLWTLKGTDTFDSRRPWLTLNSGIVNTVDYGVPPQSDQKAGPVPLADCINDTTLQTPFGPGCWQYLLLTEPAHDAAEFAIDSNDSRIQQVFYADGFLYTALDTSVLVNGDNKAGVAYFIIKPKVTPKSVSGWVKTQETLSIANNNLTYPAIAALDSGQAVMAFTVVGADYYPSAGYVGIDQDRGAGKIQIAAAGLGPDDGFTGYAAIVGTPRPRWGDYGAAATDGNSIWIASEYIAQTCTFEQYVTAPFGSCGGTRTALANWGTRISRVVAGREY